MTITIHSTTKMVELNGVPARVWEGQTESGIPVHCYITRIAVSLSEDPASFAEFERELTAHAAPTPAIAAFAMRMIL